MSNSYNDFIDFFKRHNLYNESIFNYLLSNSYMFDYRNEDCRPFIGCTYLIVNGKLNKINLVIPFFDNEICSLINVHEFIHGIMCYKYLNKKFRSDDTCEMLPMMFERLYAIESNNQNVIDYSNYIDSKITRDDYRHYLGMIYRDELIDLYKRDDNISNINRKAKILSRKNQLFNKLGLYKRER